MFIISCCIYPKIRGSFYPTEPSDWPFCVNPLFQKRVGENREGRRKEGRRETFFSSLSPRPSATSPCPSASSQFHQEWGNKQDLYFFSQNWRVKPNAENEKHQVTQLPPLGASSLLTPIPTPFRVQNSPSPLISLKTGRRELHATRSGTIATDARCDIRKGWKGCPRAFVWLLRGAELRRNRPLVSTARPSPPLSSSRRIFQKCSSPFKFRKT